MNNFQPGLISIIIRTKNEEKWIGHCLDAVFKQEVSNDSEVILVDNESTDHTIKIAKRFQITSVLNIQEFKPGYALNKGIRASKGEFIVCLSAHCIPKSKDWLSKLLRNFEDSSKIAGVYGRQLPLSFTDPVDRRDLLTVFGLDRRVQIKDYFFHNANSMLLRNVWEKYPFDEHVTNIEDRVWGKAVINAGYPLVYEPEAVVYHHHGLHQGNASERAKGVVSIIDHIYKETLNELPKSLHPENANVPAVIPIAGNILESSFEERLLHKTIDLLKRAKFVNSIYLVVRDECLAQKYDVTWIDRNIIAGIDYMSLNALMAKILEHIEGKQDYPEGLLYANYDYAFRPSGIIDELIQEALYKGYDTVFPGKLDFGHYWFHNGEGDYKQTDPSLKSREQRKPLYRALYGMGCFTSSWVIRTGNLVGGKVGILAVDDDRSALRIRDIKSERIYKAFLLTPFDEET